MCAFIVCGCLSIVSCSSDDDSDGDTGSGNTTDMAVTGAASNITTSSASIKGYINIDQAMAMLIQDFGVEYSNNAEFATWGPNSAHYKEVPGYTGREFSVELYGLQPSTTYYYRTYVHQISGMYYYGKTQSFTTEDVNVTFTVNDVTYTKANIYSPEGYGGSGGNGYFYNSTIYYSTKADGPFSQQRVEWKHGTNGAYYTLSGLEPGTTYYCYLVSSEGYTSKTFSFTTKALPFDVSGITVKCKYTPFYNSYKDRKGSTIDLKWMGGTYTVTITSNVSNQCKYGIFALKGTLDEFKLYKQDTSNENYLFYSTDTSSPYTVEATCWAGTEWWAYDNIAHIEYFLEGLSSGWGISDDEYEWLDSLVDQLLYEGGIIYPYLQAFIEIDGERIYVGSIYQMQ